MVSQGSEKTITAIGRRHGESVRITLTEPGTVEVTLRGTRATLVVAAPQTASIDRFAGDIRNADDLEDR
jgi:hypothetical protein